MSKGTTILVLKNLNLGGDLNNEVNNKNKTNKRENQKRLGSKTRTWKNNEGSLGKEDTTNKGMERRYTQE